MLTAIQLPIFDVQQEYWGTERLLLAYAPDADLALSYQLLKKSAQSICSTRFGRPGGGTSFRAFGTTIAPANR
ncbi:hypothetical protein A8B98_21660 [Hymenobacter sp. UV11]|nr:hypothetical protein A8B98_21660 [Hymenobacter sp. UV11]